MVVKRVMSPSTSQVNSQPKPITSFVQEAAADSKVEITMTSNKDLSDVKVTAKELPVHPALAQVPEHINVQDDFERVVYHHSSVDAGQALDSIKAVSINGYVIKEIEKPSVALHCHLCHARAQFRLYKASESVGRKGHENVDMFSNKLVCETHAKALLFPEPEVKEEVADGNSTDSTSTDGAVSTGSEAGTVEVPESKSDNGQTGEAVSNTP